VFRKEKYLAEHKNRTWPEELDGKEVDFSFEGTRLGLCKDRIVARDWCEQIEEGRQMRIHEILGVKPGEVFRIVGLESKYAVNPQGELIRIIEKYKVEDADAFAYRRAINDGIIKLPRLTPEQVEVLKAFKVLGCKWVTLDDSGRVEGWEIKPFEANGWWTNQERDSNYCNIAGHTACVISPLLSDTEPLDIEAALKE
jgi:hypothetical protein